MFRFKSSSLSLSTIFFSALSFFTTNSQNFVVDLTNPAKNELIPSLRPVVFIIVKNMPDYIQEPKSYLFLIFEVATHFLAIASSQVSNNHKNVTLVSSCRRENPDCIVCKWWCTLVNGKRN